MEDHGMSLRAALRLLSLKRFRSWTNYHWHGDLPPGHSGLMPGNEAPELEKHLKGEFVQVE